MNITRLVPPEGAEIGGKKFPGGTRVAINGWVLHRSKEIFGADPKVFRPKRWLEGDAKNMERYMFQFGGGSHVCESTHVILSYSRRAIMLTRLTTRYRKEPGIA